MDTGTPIAVGILAAIVITPIIIVLSMPLGVLFAPFAALICYIRARLMGLPPGRYARIGALYSTILLFPWIYLIVRMFNKTVPNFLIGIGYFVLYTMWFCGSVVVVVVIAIITGIVALGFDSDVEPTYVHILTFCTVLVVLCVNAVMWILSMVGLDRFHRNHIPSEEILPDRAYITPFAYALAWIVAAVMLWVVGLALVGKGPG